MQAVKFTDITSLDHSRIVLSGSDRRERIVPSVMNGKSVLFYHYRSYFSLLVFFKHLRGRRHNGFHDRTILLIMILLDKTVSVA